MSWETARAEFPVLERLAYLNAGSTGPLARPTGEAMRERLQADVECGRSGNAYFEEMLRLRRDVRAAFAAAIAVPPELVALTTSTTDGCNIVLAGLDLGPDDEIVTTDAEHFGLIGPLHASGARVRVAPVGTAPPEEALESILAAVTPRTRLIAVSHVLWTSGNSLLPHELKARSGLPLLVDGAQSVGAIEVDASALDFYTVSGQKWLCGPDPAGALYVADPESLRVARPTYFSQASYEPTGAFEATAGAARFDSGLIGLPALAGMEAALRDLPDGRLVRTLEMATGCRELLGERVEVVTAPAQSGLVAFRSDDPATVVRRAEQAGVIIREIPRTGLVRVSCGWWTSEGDLERLLAVAA